MKSKDNGTKKQKDDSEHQKPPPDKDNSDHDDNHMKKQTKKKHKKKKKSKLKKTKKDEEDDALKIDPQPKDWNDNDDSEEEDDEAEKKKKEEEEKRRRHRERLRREGDPDGSLLVARGKTREELAKQREELEEIIRQRQQEQQQKDDETAAGRKRSRSASLQPTDFLTSATATERLELLQRDDAQPNESKLSEKQKRALQRRRTLAASNTQNDDDKKNKNQQRRPVSERRVQHALDRLETRRLENAVAAADAHAILQQSVDHAGYLEADHDMERTTAVTQTQLKRHLLEDNDDGDDENNTASKDTARHVYDLTLPNTAPYGMEYDRSGRYSILYSRSGSGRHVALMDCHAQTLQTEFYLEAGERIRDATYLHNHTLFALAQKNHVYIYDQNGAEVHHLNEHQDPMALQFLPYHWLLASIGRAGFLKYQDTSTGQFISQHRTQLGPCHVLRQNPSNAVLHAGHANGTVTLWSPAQPTYLVKMLCHRGSPVTSLAVDLTGDVMATGGNDGWVNIWDIRHTYRQVHSYKARGGIPASLDISQRGILGIGHAGHATFWHADALKYKMKDPYMHHLIPGGKHAPIETLRFRPYEDVCGIGHGRGISSLVIPGAGEPSLDTAEYHTNPHADKKQRREAEVRALLDKLSPNMISLNPDRIGGMEESNPHHRLVKIRDMQEQANASGDAKPQIKKSKKRGKSKIQTQLRRKQQNVIDQNMLKLRQAREREELQQRQQGGDGGEDGGDSSSGEENDGKTTPATARLPPATLPPLPRESAPPALKRFFKK